MAALASRSEEELPVGRESGAVFVLAAAAMIVLLGMAAFGVDIGWIFLNKARVQRAADAAALAGVVHLPAEPSEAFTVARQIAALNGYTEGGGVTITPEVVGEKSLRVTIADTAVPTFFMRAFGIGQVTVRAKARARYVLPVPLGSPQNVFGADPTTPGRTFPEVGFWGSISYEQTDKVNGDPYATQCYTNRSGPPLSCTAPNGEFFGVDGSGEPDGYWYAVEVPTGATSLDIQVYDPGLYGTTDLDRQPWDSAWSSFVGVAERQTINYDATGGQFTLGFGGFTTAPINWDATAAQLKAALEALTSITTVNVTTGSGVKYTVEFLDPKGDVPMLVRGSQPPLLTGGTGLFTIAETRKGIPFDGGAVTYRVYAPDGSPFEYRDNPPLPGCSLRAEPAAAGTSPMDDAWVTFCSVGAGASGFVTPGVYPVRVFNSDGDGQNSYSLRALGSTAPGTSIRLYALDNMSISSTIRSGTTRFYLAEVDEVHAGKDFVVELFDPGDVSVAGTNQFSLVGPGGTVWNQGCRVEHAERPANAPAWTPLLTLTGNCTINTTRPTYDYNGDWLKITVALPNDYTCAHSGPVPDCWWKIEYDYAGRASERTTWAASVQGSLVSLEFDSP